MKKTITKECKKHGSTNHLLESSKYWRCGKCRVEAVQKRRDKLKELAVTYNNGKCTDCGLISEHYSIYEFHHMNPSKKDFGIGHKGYTRSWKSIQKELDKCVMLCANCHRIRHSKIL